MNGKAELFGEWNRGLAGWCVNKDNGWERREWTWWNGFILWVCLREREIEQQGVLLLLVLQDSHLQVSGLEEKNVREAGTGLHDIDERSGKATLQYCAEKKAATFTLTPSQGRALKGTDYTTPCPQAQTHSVDVLLLCMSVIFSLYLTVQTSDSYNKSGVLHYCQSVCAV